MPNRMQLPPRCCMDRIHKTRCVHHLLNRPHKQKRRLWADGMASHNSGAKGDCDAHRCKTRAATQHP